MKGKLYTVLSCIVLLLDCKKENTIRNFFSSDLYPLALGNRWLYIDSFFTQSGNYFGKDTFYLKTSSTIIFNNHVFTPITDQYDDSIFVLRVDDTAVYMLRPHGESLFYSRHDTTQAVKTIIYNGGASTTMIYTERIMTTSYPSYKIVFTEDNGVLSNFRRQEYFFTVGLGVIEGKNQRKSSLGNIYTTDSYSLYSFSVK